MNEQVETRDITYDFNEWVKIMLEKQANMHVRDKSELYFTFDVHIADSLLKDHFDGFMTAPVAYIEGKSIEGKSRVVKSIDDLVNIKSILDKEPGKKFLYSFHYFFPRWRTYEYDPDTFEIIKPEKPFQVKDGWTIRYGTLGEK